MSEPFVFNRQHVIDELKKAVIESFSVKTFDDLKPSVKELVEQMAQVQADKLEMAFNLVMSCFPPKKADLDRLRDLGHIL